MLRTVSSEERREQHVEVRVEKSQLGEVLLEDQQTTRATRVVNKPRKAPGACGSTWKNLTHTVDQQVKAGDAAREQSRVTCHNGWLLARGVMRTVMRSSSSKTAVGVSTEGLQQCKKGILQRVLGARN